MGKIGPKVASDFYTQLYTFCQRSSGRRMDARFLGSYDFENCTFNPFVVGSTPARPTTERPTNQQKPAIKLIVGFFVWLILCISFVTASGKNSVRFGLVSLR